MLRGLALFALAAAASAFQAPALVTPSLRSASVCSVNMQADGVSRRDLLKTVAAFGVAAVPAIANANVEYANLPFLGGGDQIDINNANIRVYTKLQGMYPSIAGMIVKNGPYKSIDEVYNIKTLTPKMKEIIKKYEGNLVALEVAPEFREDVFNNGLYR